MTTIHKEDQVVTNDHLDERDQKILEHRIAMLDADERPRVGDYVEFADDVVRRISHLWRWEAEPEDSPMLGAQTSDLSGLYGGNYYLGEGYCSFSGGLHSLVPFNTLELTDEKRPGSVWFFSHDHWTAHNGVPAVIPFRVYKCTREAPK